MTTWTDLTDEQRASVLATLEAAVGRRGFVNYPPDMEAHAAARVVLLAAHEERITAEAIADACVECGIHEDEAAEDVPSFVRRLRRERDEWRVVCGRLAGARGEAAEAEAREAKLRDAAEWVVKSWGEPDADENSFDADLRAALALPADRAVLDAMLAEARREGTRACVEAARAARIGDCSGHTIWRSCATCALAAAHAILAAVERAAAAFVEKEPTP